MVAVLLPPGLAGLIASILGFSGSAGPLPGYGGWFDFNNAINAMKRKDGEYILVAEDDGAQKVKVAVRARCPHDRRPTDHVGAGR